MTEEPLHGCATWIHIVIYCHLVYSFIFFLTSITVLYGSFQPSILSHSLPREDWLIVYHAECAALACVESVSVWFRSKEGPRNLSFNYFLVLYQRISYSVLSAGYRWFLNIYLLKGSLSFYLAIVSCVDWILTRFDDKRSNHTAIFFPDKALVSKNQTHTSINAFLYDTRNSNDLILLACTYVADNVTTY